MTTAYNPQLAHYLERFFIASRRSALETIQAKYKGCAIVDVTSRAQEPWVRFSPFFPHDSIPVPFSQPWVAASVEGIWQGLKVFEREDVDVSKFSIRSMKNLKRSTRRLGKVVGHRKGVAGTELLTYVEARRQIYIPTYTYVLRTHLSNLLLELAKLAARQGLVLLDYETNVDQTNTKTPLSHAGLIKENIVSNWVNYSGMI